MARVGQSVLYSTVGQLDDTVQLFVDKSYILLEPIIFSQKVGLDYEDYFVQMKRETDNDELGMYDI